MKKIMKSIIAFICVLLAIVVSTSCHKESFTPDNIKQTNLSLLTDKEAFSIYQKAIAPLHSEGLEYIFKMIQKDHSNMKKIEPLTDQFMNTTKIKNILKDYEVNYLDASIKDKEQALKETEYLNSLCYYFIDKIHDSSKAPLTVDQLKKETIKILDDKEFQNLSKERRHVIMTGISVYEDSYAYWISNLTKWDKETQPATNELNIWGRLKRIAKADLAGAVGGAVGGAVAGSLAGGVGAVPGAVAGAVGTAVAGSVTSALTS